MTNKAPQPAAAHPQEPTRCPICNTLVDPDLGWSELPPADLPGKQKSWTPNMSQEFHRELQAVKPLLSQQAYWFGVDAHGLTERIRQFIANPHQQDFFGDRLCNLRDGTHHLLACLQSLATLLERLDIEKGYNPPAVLPRPLTPTIWRSWTRTLLPL